MLEETKHVKKFRENHLKDGETIIAWSEGYIVGKGDDKQHNGVLIITETLAAFYRKNLFSEVFESIPLKNITSIERKSLMLMQTIHLHSGHASHSDLTFNSPIMKKVIDAIDAGRQTQTTPTAQTAPITPITPISTITKKKPIKKKSVKKTGLKNKKIS